VEDRVYLNSIEDALIVREQVRRGMIKESSPKHNSAKKVLEEAKERMLSGMIISNSHPIIIDYMKELAIESGMKIHRKTKSPRWLKDLNLFN